MTKSQENVAKQTKKEDLSHDKIAKISDTMSDILKLSNQEILKSIDLFANMNDDLLSCLSKLSKVQDKDYITVSMILDYILQSKEVPFDKIL